MEKPMDDFNDIGKICSYSDLYEKSNQIYMNDFRKIFDDFFDIIKHPKFEKITNIDSEFISLKIALQMIYDVTVNNVDATSNNIEWMTDFLVEFLDFPRNIAIAKINKFGFSPDLISQCMDTPNVNSAIITGLFDEINRRNEKIIGQSNNTAAEIKEPKDGMSSEGTLRIMREANTKLFTENKKLKEQISTLIGEHTDMTNKFSELTRMVSGRQSPMMSELNMGVPQSNTSVTQESDKKIKFKSMPPELIAQLMQYVDSSN